MMSLIDNCVFWHLKVLRYEAQGSILGFKSLAEEVLYLCPMFLFLAVLTGRGLALWSRLRARPWLSSN